MDERIKEVLDIASKPLNFEKVFSMNKIISCKELLLCQKRDRLCRKLVRTAGRHSDFMLNHEGLLIKQSADDVIHAYIETILPLIGPSRFSLMDNGTEFKNDTMSNVLNRLNTEHKFTMVYCPRGNSRLEHSHTLLKRSISKYIDILDVEWDKCLNLAMYAFNISPSSDNCSSPYYIVYGKEPIDTELKELKELHWYTGINCGLKCLQQLNEIWKNHVDKLR